MQRFSFLPSMQGRVPPTLYFGYQPAISLFLVTIGRRPNRPRNIVQHGLFLLKVSFATEISFNQYFIFLIFNSLDYVIQKILLHVHIMNQLLRFEKPLTPDDREVFERKENTRYSGLTTQDFLLTQVKHNNRERA
jgi:hypothetical protein